MTAMSPEKQRIAIAMACGWRPMPFDYWLDPQGGHHGCFGAGDERKFLPDYLGDLNAMRDAECHLGFNRSDYDRALAEACRQPSGKGFGHNRTHATAAHRAEAFLRTLNLWKETKS